MQLPAEQVRARAAGAVALRGPRDKVIALVCWGLPGGTGGHKWPVDGLAGGGVVEGVRGGPGGGAAGVRWRGDGGPAMHGQPPWRTEMGVLEARGSVGALPLTVRPPRV